MPLQTLSIARIFVLTPLFTVGCSTALEVLEGSDGGYRAIKDTSGHTKYVRSRTLTPLDSYSSVPTYVASPYSYDYGYNHTPVNAGVAVGTFLNALGTVSKIAVTSVSADSIHENNRQSLQKDLYAGAVAVIDASPVHDDSYSGSGLAVAFVANNETASGDLSYEWMNEFISGGLGIAFVSSDRNYFGFNGSIRAHYPWIVSPFLGVGLYAGDSKTCSYQPQGYGITREDCEKYYLFAATADAGVQLNFEKNFVVRVFARGFSQTRQGDPLGDTLYGTSFAFVF